ncbi:MAG: SEC-C metal-binding domain-containing protein [Nanoarchaeota archaeon]
MEKEKIKSLIIELQKYDNPKGYKLNYKEVKDKLSQTINSLILCKDECLDELHALISYEETWSCLFALEVIKEIKSKKSIDYLINYIVKTEEGEHGDSGEEAMFALTNIGATAIDPLLKEIKNQFSKRKFYFYLIGALTEIKDEKVYEFMKEVTEDYIQDEEKYDEWFHIDVFTSDFDKQGKKEILLILKELIKLDRVSKHEKIEIEDSIERIEDPIEYQKKTKEQFKKMKPFIEKFMAQKSDSSDIGKEELEERMWTPEKDLEIQFKCQNCHKKQSINPGLIKIIDGKKAEFSFENEIMCKFCFSNDIKLTKQGSRDIMFQAIGTVEGVRKGVLSVGDKIYVEDKLMPFNKSYDYILKRLNDEPNNAGLYLRAGNVSKNFNKYKDAIKYYEKAIELNPRLIASYLNLVEIYEFRYKYYNVKDANVSAVFYLNEMIDIFRTQNFDALTIKNKDSIISFMGEKSESLGVYVPELITIPIPYKKDKVGRNEPCPCGSGKKYKKCCLNGKEK